MISFIVISPIKGEKRVKELSQNWKWRIGLVIVVAALIIIVAHPVLRHGTWTGLKWLSAIAGICSGTVIILSLFFAYGRKPLRELGEKLSQVDKDHHHIYGGAALFIGAFALSVVLGPVGPNWWPTRILVGGGGLLVASWMLYYTLWKPLLQKYLSQPTKEGGPS